MGFFDTLKSRLLGVDKKVDQDLKKQLATRMIEDLSPTAVIEARNKKQSLFPEPQMMDTKSSTIQFAPSKEPISVPSQLPEYEPPTVIKSATGKEKVFQTAQPDVTSPQIRAKVPFLPYDVGAAPTIDPVQRGVQYLTKAIVEFPETVAKTFSQAMSFGVNIDEKLTKPSVNSKGELKPQIYTVIDHFKYNIENDPYYKSHPGQAFSQAFFSGMLDLTTGGAVLKNSVKKQLSKLPVAQRNVENAKLSMGLQMNQPITKNVAADAYRRTAKIVHPDVGGTAEAMSKLNTQYGILQKELVKRNGFIEAVSKTDKVKRKVLEAIDGDIKNWMKNPEKEPFLGVKGLLPEKAGTIPTKPFQPYRQPKFGLATREVPSKPAVSPKVKKTYTGKEVAKEAKTLGSDQGGLSDFTIGRIAKENYITKKVSINDLRKGDPDLNEYLKSGEIRDFEGEPFGMNPIVSSGGEVIDGYNRISQAIKDGDESISVLFGVSEKTGVSKVSIDIDKDLAKTLRGTKGMTADDIMKKHPNIQLKRDVVAKDVHGNKEVIPKGEALTPYEMKDGKILLQDGETYLVNKNQFQNIKGNAVSGEVKDFAPELKGTEETIMKDGDAVGSPDVSVFDTQTDEVVDTFNSVGEAEAFIERSNNDYYSIDETMLEDDVEALSPTKYSQYQLPDGKNYKEILIKAPEVKASNPYAKHVQEMTKKYGKNWNDKVSYEERQKGISLFSVKGQEEIHATNFKSSHWEEPNVISHLRMNERTYKGKKVSFMEELQSDWAREGREKGFMQNLTELPEGSSVTKEGAEWKIEIPNREYVYFGDTKESAITKALDDIKKEGIPNNPLLKKWQEMSTKRALKEAVDTNAEYFAWINGKQTSARYDLATQLDDVKWTSNKYDAKEVVLKEKSGNKIDVNVDSKTGVINSSIQGGWEGKKLDEVLGKGLADKIMEKPKGTLSGEGLSFGGEWASNLYDRQVANIVKDLTGADVIKMDMGLPISKKTKWEINAYNNELLTPENIKVGIELVNEADTKFIVIEVLENGKFRAVPKMKTFERDGYSTKDILEWSENNSQAIETFDISVEKTIQQGIELTPEVKAKIRGEAPKIKTSGKMFGELYGGMAGFEIDEDGNITINSKKAALGILGMKAVGKQMTPKQVYKIRKRIRDIEKKAIRGEIGALANVTVESNISRLEDINSGVLKGIKSNPYYRKEKTIKDDMGKGWLMSKALRGKQSKKHPKGKVIVNYVVATPKELDQFLLKGFSKDIEIDTLASEAGFEDGLEYLENQLELGEISRSTNVNNIVKKKLLETDEEYAGLIEQLQDTKTMYAVGKIETAKEILDKRRTTINAIKNFFELTDDELKQITRKDIRLMSDKDFMTFIDDLRTRAEDFAERRQAQNELMQQIFDKELNIDPIRRAYGIKPISKLTTSQLKRFDEALKPYLKGDVFLSPRQLQTVSRTKLGGARTQREVREIMAKEIGTTPDKLTNIQSKELDRAKGDTVLAETNPIYRLFVESANERLIVKEKEYYDIEKKTLRLAKKLKTSFVGKLIPQHKNIVKWFEAENKNTVQLTKAEADLVNFMQEEWSDALEYLVKMEALKYGMSSDNYFTHLRRGVLESVKEVGAIKAIKELAQKYKVEEQNFQIRDATGELLSYDKFFGNALHRTGAMIPTDNVVKAFLTYMRTLKKKQALDEIAPLIDVYAHSIVPKKLSKTGVLIHGNLLKFVKEWINTKKGKHITLIAKQGGKIEGAIRALTRFTSVLDLAINIPIQIASLGGEQVTTYAMLGKKAYVLGKYRMLTKQGKKIISENTAFVGRNPWSELIEPAKNAGERLMEAMFIGFRDATVRANKNFLLGSLTKEEFKTGIIDPKKLAQMKISMGRFRHVEGAVSILGATPEAGMQMQYKKWAIPIMQRVLQNVYNLKTLLSKNKTKGKQSLLEFYRILEITSFVLIIKALLPNDEEDKSFVGQLISKFYRELTTLMQGANPVMFLAKSRIQTFLTDLIVNLNSIIKAEEYQSSRLGEYYKGQKKGVVKLKKQLTPRFVKIIQNGLTAGHIDYEKARELKKKEWTAQLEKGEITEIELANKIIKFEKDKASQLAYEKMEAAKTTKEREKLLAELTPAEVKGALTIKGKMLKDAKEMESKSDKTFIGKILIYAKAIGTDPITAFNRIFTGQKIRRTDNGAIIVERMPLSESQAIRKEVDAGVEVKLDHTIPLQLGGSNNKSNLELVTTEDWKMYTPIENYLGKLLRAKTIDKEDAQKYIKDFKNGKITEEEIRSIK